MLLRGEKRHGFDVAGEAAVCQYIAELVLKVKNTRRPRTITCTPIWWAYSTVSPL